MTRKLLPILVGTLACAQAAAQPSPQPGGAPVATWGDAPAPRTRLELAAPPSEAKAPPAGSAPAPAIEHASPRQRNAGHRAAKPPARDTATAGAALGGGCPDADAQWARAERSARAGQAEDAYARYLSLLRTCTAPGELEGTAWKAAKALPAPLVDRLLADPLFDKPSLRATRNALRLSRMYDENAAGHFDRALAYSRTLRADGSVTLDASALEVSGWLEDRAHDDAAAERLFRAALAEDPSRDSARLGLALALVHQQRLDEAEAVSRDLSTPQGRRVHASVALAQARTSRDPARVDAALALIDETGGASDAPTRASQAWALLSSGRAARAESIFRELHEAAPESDEYLQGLTYAAVANRDYAVLRTVEAENRPATPALARETLAAHEASRALYDRARALTGHPVEAHEPALQSLFSIDRKSGTAGRDRLTVWTMPQLSLTLLPASSLTVRIDAALLRLDNDVRHAWGKQLGATMRTELGEGELTAGLALEAPGRGPTQLLGQLGYLRMAESEDEFVRATFAREAIHDSLRAYEGASGGPGPTISNTLAFAARQAVGASGWHIGESLAAGAVTASSTAANPFYAAGLSFTRDFRVKYFSWLNAGAEARASSYRYDANRYDGPYAGYWSPKSNREAGLVFNAQSEEGGRFLFKTGARLGYAARQLYTGRASGVFGEDTTTLASLVSRNLIVGAGVGYRASPGYQDMNVFAWVKIPFEPRAHLRAADLVTPRGF